MKICKVRKLSAIVSGSIKIFIVLAFIAGSQPIKSQESYLEIDSLDAYYKVLSTSRQMQDTSTMLEAMSGIEKHYYQIGLLDSAVAYCTEAIEINKLAENYRLLSDNYRSLSTYLSSSFSGVLDTSFFTNGLMDSCLIAAAKAQDPVHMVFTLANYGLDYYERSPEISLEYLNKAVDSAKLLPENTDALAYALTLLSEVYVRLDQIDLAKKNLSEALVLALKSNDNQRLTYIYYILARCYSKQDSTNLALDNFYHSIDLAEKHHYSYYLPFIYNELFDLYYSKGIMDSSYAYQKKYMDVIENQHNKEMSLQVARLSAKFQVDQKVEAIDNLTVINDQKKAIIRNQNKFIVSLILGITLGAFLFLVFLYQFRKIKTAHHQLAQNALELKKKNKLIADLKKERDLKMELVSGDLKISLIELFEKKEIYLDKNLSLSQTANLLMTNTSYLSAVINKEYKCKFNHFVNKYRVEKACELFNDRDMDKYSIEGIAGMAGFKSKSVFNPVFKKATGVAPSEYRSSLSGKY